MKIISSHRYQQMTVKLFDKLDEINQDNWDQFNANGNLLHSYNFLKVLEISQVEASKLFFLMIYEDKKLIGTTVLSLFELNLDLFIHARATTKVLKTIYPNLFKTKVLICGTPISAGHKNIYHLPEYGLQVYAITAEIMEQIASETKTNTIIFKELDDAALQQANILVSSNYFQAYSIPSAELESQFASFEEYLNAMRHSYRRQIKNSLKKIENQGIEISHEKISTVGLDLLYRLYLSVMDRSNVKLEVLTKDFFNQFFTYFQDQAKILVCKKDTQILGIFIYFIQNKTLTFLWTCRNQSKDDYDSYQNLLIELFKIGMNKKCTTIVLGQTAYYPKQRMGAALNERFIYVKSRNKIIHFLLESFNTLIFPKLNLPKLNVFKSTENGSTKKYCM